MRILVLTLLLSGGSAFAFQDPPVLKLPSLSGDRDIARAVSVSAVDPVSLYRDRREAAIAAFQSGYQAATIGKSRSRALGMFLIAARRDPTFGKTLFNLGVLCTQEERWQDALDFYQEAQQKDPGLGFGPMIASERARVEAILRMESTPEGKKDRQFAIRFGEILARRADAVITLDETLKLAKQEPERWEPQALIGVLQAGSGRYAESVKALETASRLAPSAKQVQLRAALDMARRENSFEEHTRSADKAWQEQKFDAAAKLYASAWDDSPARVASGMQAAVAYLMADQIKPGVEILSRIRNSSSADLRVKSVAMLRELGALSEEAKRQAALGEGAQREASAGDLAAKMQAQIGNLMSPQGEIVIGRPAALLDDRAVATHIADTEIDSPQSDLLLASTKSIFALYRQRASQAGAEAPLDAPSAPLTAPLTPPPAGPPPG